MSPGDDRSRYDDEDEDGPEDDRHIETGETSGLGLTEEFRRIESELEGGTGEQPAGDARRDEAEAPSERTEEWNGVAGEDDRADADEWVPDEEPGAPERGADTGAWTGEFDAPHDTGEWIGATDEAEAQAVGELSGETGERDPVGERGDSSGFEPVSEEFEPVSEEFEPVSEEFEPVSGEFEPVSGEFEPVSGEFEPVSEEFEHVSEEHPQPTGDAEPVSAEHEEVSGEHDAPAEGPAGEPDAEPSRDPVEGDAPGPAAPVEPHTRVQRSKPAAEAAIAAAGAVGARATDDRPTEVSPPPTDRGSLTPIPPGPPVTAAGGYGGMPPGDDVAIKVPSLWWRFFSGSVLIVMAVAASVAVAGLLFFEDIAADIRGIPKLTKNLSAVESDDPQTILIIGSDRRKGDEELGARSDTTMLLRVDPTKDVLSLFSLPRDLEVDIPGYGTDKLNVAYTVGGAAKTLATVKKYTGLDINHVVEINFNGFAKAVNAIDCVYVDVDRDYFNDNSQALSEEETYAAIDVDAGYQRLCGLKALQYVRYRHTDSDLVRAARQQDFLREARQKVQPTELLPVVSGTSEELIEIFTDHTRSDIDSVSQIIGMLRSFIAVRDAAVNEVHFEGDLGDAFNTNVTTTPEQLEAAIDQFLNGVGSQGSRGGEEATQKKKDKEPKPEEEKKEESDSGDGISDADVVPVDQLADAGSYDSFAKEAAKERDMNVFVPTVVAPNSTFSDGSRHYSPENEDNEDVNAYKIVIEYAPEATLPEYYGVMGITWDDPPILRNPSETREIDGREYLLFYDGDRLRLVGWKQDGNSYWVNNTLTQSLSPDQMLAMATTMREVG